MCHNTGIAEQKRALEKGPPRPGVLQYRDEHQAAHERWANVLDRGVWLKGYWRVVWQIEPVYAPGVNAGFQGGGGGSARVDAVGMKATHNAIHHGPHAGVLINSFDNVFEYNKIFQSCQV